MFKTRCKKIVSTGPIIVNLPELAANCFTGREPIFRDLEALLESRSIAAIAHPVEEATYGWNGFKTQLVIKYVHMNVSRYLFIAWFNAETSENIMSGYIDLAVQLGIPTRRRAKVEIMTQIDIMRQIHDRLNQSRGWLLVFDNAEDFSTLKPYLPKKNRGHVIITSRNRDWGDIPMLALPLFDLT